MVMKLFGRPENDPGQLFTIETETQRAENGDDIGKRDIELRIRRMPPDLQMRMERRYGREEMIPDPGNGFKRPQHVTTQDDNLNIMKDKAEWAWTDCVNLEVEMCDEEAAEQWTKLLASPVRKGEKVLLDGKLTTQIKRVLFSQNYKIPVFIMGKVAELNAMHSEKAERLQGN